MRLTKSLSGLVLLIFLCLASVQAQENAEKNSSYATLADLEHLAGKPEAADHMLQAARLEPARRLGRQPEAAHRLWRAEGA